MDVQTSLSKDNSQKKEEHGKKGIFLICSISLFVLFLLSCMIYVLFKNSKTIIVSPTTSNNQTTDSAINHGQPDPYENWNNCENAGLALSIKIPQNWNCTNKDAGLDWGFITISGDSFTIEIENEGRGFGCMEYSGCSDVKIYENDLVPIYLETVDNVDKYMYGIFKDNDDQRNYGGVYITYNEIEERKMTQNETELLFKILDTMKRQR